MEEAASSSHHLVADPDPAAMQLDSDDAMLSRSNSVQPLTEGENGTDIRSLSRRDKGKGKERGVTVRVKEEAITLPLNANDPPHLNASVSNVSQSSSQASYKSLSRTRITVLRVAHLDRSSTATDAQEHITSSV